MRLQSAQNFCGFATAANALRAIGRRVTEDQVHAKVKLGADGVDEPTTMGATEQQIIKGLRAFRVEVTQFQVHSELAAVNLVRGCLLAGRPVVLAVDNDAHWVVAFGLMGGLVHVADCAHEEIVLSYTEARLLARWGHAGDPPRWYGLALNVRR